MSETIEWTLEGDPDFLLNKRVLVLGSDALCDLRAPGIPGQVAQILVLGAKVSIEALRSGLKLDGEVVLPGGRAPMEENSRLEIAGRSWCLRRPRSAPVILSVEPVLQAVEALVDASDPVAVLPQLLQFAGQHLNANGGVLVSASEGGTVASWPAGETIEHSRSAVKACQEAGRAVLWADAGPSDAPLAGPSILKGGIRSILVAPLRDPQGRIDTFVYLHRTGKGEPFGEFERKAFDRLVRSLDKVLQASRRHHEDRKALESLQASDSAGLLAVSSQMQAVVAQARRFSGANVPVLVLGETGTGKELLARLVHRASPRKNGPFLAVNCAAIPSSLMEAELFGHEKGAFTGAAGERLGLFESANGGTLFLDEIGELELQMQAALLRVLQEKTIRRVGSSQERPIDVRIVAATHRNLDKMVEENHFRRDLLFRLNVASVRIPPLRERFEDVLPLGRLFAQRASAEFGIHWTGFSRAAEKALLRHGWPGNVRELENRIQRALLEACGARLEPAHFGFDPEGPGDGQGTLAQAREAAERVAIEKALARAGGNLTQAGAILDVDRKVLRDVLKRLGMYHKGGEERED